MGVPAIHTGLNVAVHVRTPNFCTHVIFKCVGWTFRHLHINLHLRCADTFCGVATHSYLVHIQLAYVVETIKLSIHATSTCVVETIRLGTHVTGIRY